MIHSCEVEGQAHQCHRYQRSRWVSKGGERMEVRSAVGLEVNRFVSSRNVSSATAVPTDMPIFGSIPPSFTDAIASLPVFLQYGVTSPGDIEEKDVH